MKIGPLAFKPTVAVARLLQGALLLAFATQLLLIACLISLGFIPIPKDWGNALIKKYAPADLTIEVEAIRIRSFAQLEIIGLQVSSTLLDQPLLVAGMSELQLGWLSGPTKRIGVKGLTVTDGTLYMPSVYSPSGKRSALVEKIAFHLTPASDQIHIDSFAALHDEMRLRGTAEWPLTIQQRRTPRNRTTAGLIDQTYKQIAQLIKESARFNPFIHPTLLFKLELLENESVQISTRLSSRRLNHEELIGQNILIDSAFQLKNGQLDSSSSIRFKASKLEAPRLKTSAESVYGQFSQEDWSALANGEWPELEFSAEALTIHNYRIEAPKLQIDPSDYPRLQVSGSADGLKGAAEFSGQIDLETQSAELTAQGNVDLLSLIPKTQLQKLPQLEFSQAPYYALNLSMSPGFELESLQVQAQTQQLTVNGIRFDHIQAKSQITDGIFTIDDLYLRRGPQWINLNFNLDRHSLDYHLGLCGSAVPYEYNSILPGWWTSIFKDFDFSQVEYSYGDFMIYGNAKSKLADLYYGHAQVQKAAYRGVQVDEADLIVLGRGHYTELKDLNAKSGDAWAHGNIAFSSLPDAISAPVSIRIDFEAQLPLEDTAKLFGGNVAEIINDFESEQLPTAHFTAAIFNKAYPHYSNRTYFDLHANSKGPVRYKKVPLDHIDFSLFGRQHSTALRDINFGFAGGSGSGSIDINTPNDAEPNLRLQLQATGADKDTALLNLAPVLGDSIPSNKATEGAVTALSLKLHAQGPTADPLKFKGYGEAELLDPKLGALKLLGPLSTLLEETPLSFTSLTLDRLKTNFQLDEDIIKFTPLIINGPSTQILAPGTLRMSTQELDMRVSISPFANLGHPQSALRRISDFVQSPIPNLLQFDLSGTLDKPRWRSLYDPRNLLPALK